MAWKILLAWETGDSALEAVRERLFKRSALDPRDRALITELTQGVVRHLSFIDHSIRSNLDRPEISLPLPVVMALRLGIYQLAHLYRIPAHAAVKETVQIIKDSRYRRYSSLTNAILRKIAEKGPSTIPPMEKDLIRHIELATSSPRWLVKLLVNSYGPEETRRILQALNHTPPLTMRVNTTRTSREALIQHMEELGLTVNPGKLSRDAIIMEDRIPPRDLIPFREGLCTVQDEGAQLIAPLLDPLPGQSILDACAAPGGKTGHLAERMSGTGLLVAADMAHRRMGMLSENLDRLGAHNVRLLTADLSLKASPLVGDIFDAVLLDAPCSGTGVLRRHPEGKWKKDPETISQMTMFQMDLLASTVRTLKNGGRLLYTTCSILEEENEKVVDRFLSNEARLVRIDMRGKFPDMRQDIFSDRGELRLWPHIHNCDGFFACLMEKK